MRTKGNPQYYVYASLCLDVETKDLKPKYLVTNLHGFNQTFDSKEEMLIRMNLMGVDPIDMVKGFGC